MFIGVPIARKIYGNEALQLMFNGHIDHSPEEIRRMIGDLLRSGVEYGVKTPNFAQLKNWIDLKL